MTGGSKIIGMWRDRENDPENDIVETEESAALPIEKDDISSMDSNELDTPPAEEEWHHYADDEGAGRRDISTFIPLLMAIVLTGWTGLFLWANRDIFTTLPTLNDGLTLLNQWCLPAAVIGIIYLLLIRNSTREASRFAQVASSLRAESELLESRLQTVNNELSVAREFLTQQTKELEFLGEQSAGKLTTAAGQIQSSLESGLGTMRKLDEVGGTAYKNLEQLREHLPVVINTAKDVTNQIGNSGRSAQIEMSAMLATLKNISETGATANQKLNELTKASEDSVLILAAKAEEIKTDFAQQLKQVETGSTKFAAVLKSTSQETIDALRQTREALVEETSQSASAMRSDLDLLEAALASAGNIADEEEQRLKSLGERLKQDVVEITESVKTLDNQSGEKTAELAFAMTALEQNSEALQQSLQNGYGIADGMIERMERLLMALDSSSREMDETLPAAFNRVTEKSNESLTLYNQIAEEAEKAGQSAQALTDQIDKAGATITEQQVNMDRMKDQSETTSRSIVEQITEISQSLDAVREQNEALTESAGEKLISALLRVKDTAKQASEHSREALEKSITGSAEKFEEISEEALSRIIDEKIGSIAPKLEEAVSSAVATTQSTAGHLTEQLAAIEDMTTGLEQRILFAKEKAEQSSDENFTRRVAQLTESLNSTAIDVSKILSNDVPDTEWAAYLKGDRGIFTRRSVRLLDSGEVREILEHYENDDEFREHVNRYIHDFETMLRGILATRDGSAISVTLLSSDIGKLYVALAQAIERLRK
jgi:hypothetical protein